MDKSELLCGGAADIDYSAVYEGCAIVDSHNSRFAVAKVLDADARAKRQGGMRTGQRTGGVRLTAGGEAASLIPGRFAALTCRDGYVDSGRRNNRR
jgi:hypothetical protein